MLRKHKSSHRTLVRAQCGEQGCSAEQNTAPPTCHLQILTSSARTITSQRRLRYKQMQRAEVFIRSALRRRFIGVNHDKPDTGDYEYDESERSNKKSRQLLPASSPLITPPPHTHTVDTAASCRITLQPVSLDVRLEPKGADEGGAFACVHACLHARLLARTARLYLGLPGAAIT